MGITKIDDMPNYNEARAEIVGYKNTQNQQDQESDQINAVKDLESEMETTNDVISDTP